jgi:sugar phosphate isomerase/epimerase
MYSQALIAMTEGSSHAAATRIGMTVAFPRLGVEEACQALKELGFAAVEVFTGQVGTGMVDLPLGPAYGRVLSQMFAALELEPVMLNAIDGTFEPLLDADAAADRLAAFLRLADAADIPAVLVWDGRLANASAATAPATLAATINEARGRSGLASCPAISVELHAFTFTLARRMLEETAEALSDVDAGICVDFCHFAYALGTDFARYLTPAVVKAVNRIHWCDADGETDSLHMPPGEGCLDLDLLAEVFAGRGLPLSWDMFAWPSPRLAALTAMPTYDHYLERNARVR